MKIIDRYILKELMPPFILGVMLFTFVLLINRIFKLTDLIVNKGISLLEVLKLLSYVMPALLTLTIPMAVLLAALVAFGRLSTDCEVTALKASGFSLPRLMAPVLAFSVIACFVTSYMTLYLGPEKTRTFRKDLFVLAKTHAAIGIEEAVFNDTFKNVVIYTSRTPSPNEMQGVFISDERNPANPYVIIAQKGVVDVDPATGYAYLDLMNGSIHKRGNSPGSYQEMTFKKNSLSINLYEKFFSEEEVQKSKREMSLGELLKLAKEMQESGDKNYQLLTEYYKRFTIPLACIIFGMVGPPLGLYARRSGRSMGMSMALAVFVLYYLLMKGGENLASGGYLPPLVAVLIPNVVIGGLGALLMASAAKEKSLDPAALVEWYRRWKRVRARKSRVRGMR